MGISGVNPFVMRKPKPWEREGRRELWPMSPSTWICGPFHLLHLRP